LGRSTSVRSQLCQKILFCFPKFPSWRVADKFSPSLLRLGSVWLYRHQRADQRGGRN
jgi:hypothetical protein